MIIGTVNVSGLGYGFCQVLSLVDVRGHIFGLNHDRKPDESSCEDNDGSLVAIASVKFVFEFDHGRGRCHVRRL